MTVLVRTRQGPRAVPARVAASATLLEQQLGGRDAIVHALCYAPKSREVEYLLGLLGDPAHARVPLASLCVTGGMTIGEVVEAFRAGELNRAQALSTVEISAKLPEVVADTMRMALPHEGRCPECDGRGCARCDGEGKIEQEGDLDHKKLALDLGKLLPKAAGMSIVNQNLLQAMGASGGTLEQMQLATDQVLYGSDGLDAPDPLVDPIEAPTDGEIVVEGPEDPA